MSQSASPPDLRQTAGLVGGLLKQARLVWRLLKDNRVPAAVKLIPLAGLLYLLSPIDLIPDLMLPGLGEVDDVVLLLLALKMFVDLSPSGIVRQHLEELFGRPQEPPSGPTIDAPYRVVDGGRDIEPGGPHV